MNIGIHRNWGSIQGRYRLPAIFFAAAVGAISFDSSAATLGTELVAGGFDQPLFVTEPLADGRVFVVEKGGTIKAVQNGVTSDFLSVPVATTDELGLMGLAFDPDYAKKGAAGFGRFFVSYSDQATNATVVASYRTGSNSLGDPTTRQEVLRIDQPAGQTNHKGGWIGFKPGDHNDLYIVSGDGGGGDDLMNKAQDHTSLLGKILRVDINHDAYADPNINYAIPTTNPFVGDAGTRSEIYALGVRNPWRDSFDSKTGDFWIADVGQGAREEIDKIAAGSAGGQNFGWRVREGDIATPGNNDAPIPGLTDPLLVYPHDGDSKAITGGYVVHDAKSPLDGDYVFGDFVTGDIWAIKTDGSVTTLAQATDLSDALNPKINGSRFNLVSFGEGAGGELYLVDFFGGRVLQVTAVPEPSSVALLLAGGAFMVQVVRRRRRAASATQS